MRKQDLHPRIKQHTNLQKHHSKHSRNVALEWLAHRFPEAFDNSTHIHPLKVGIMADILDHADEAEQEGISRSKLREAVVVYTRRIDYLVCLKSQEIRVDLYGHAVEQVTEEEAERAAAKIRKRVEKTVRNAKKITPFGMESSSKEHDFWGQDKVLAKQKPVHTPYIERNIERTPAFHADHGLMKRKNPTTVVVKTKTPRSYDPNAVARLKEKLGLSSLEKAD